MLTFGIIAAILILYYLFHRPSHSPVGAPSNDAPNKDLQRVQKAMKQCTADHPDAAIALMWLASSDGVISKQEPRILLRFCRDQGSDIDKSVDGSLERLTGMNARVEGGPSRYHGLLSAISEKDRSYRISFIGAAHQIVGTNKRVSKQKREFLSSAEAILIG